MAELAGEEISYAEANGTRFMDGGREGHFDHFLQWRPEVRAERKLTDCVISKPADPSLHDFTST